MDSNLNQRLRVGIVGCGKVAEHHARFIKEQANADLCTVADVNRQAAESFSRKFAIPAFAASVDELLDNTQLDVLHVVTPPAFHYQSARAALDRGIHVFVEKPVAFTVDEVADLYDRATANHAMLCPDFIQLFHPKMLELTERIERGELGRIVHVESQLCINLEDSPELREAVGLHWSYRLPGGLLRDYAPHVLYLALYFCGWPEQIQVARVASGQLPQGMLDHVSVQVNGSIGTASVLLSCLPRPSRYGVRVYGERGSAEVSFDTQTLLLNTPSFLPRRLTSATGNFTQSWSLSKQATSNIYQYLTGKLVPYAGMQKLLPRVYDAVLRGSEPPVTRDLALAVTMAEEAIFSSPTNLVAKGLYARSTQREIRQRDRVLVTGASGYLGRQVVAALMQNGYFVRALVRPTSSIRKLENLGPEIFFGDIRSLDDVSAAAEGMNIVVHLAAGIQGSPEFVVDSCVKGTQNIADAAKLQSIRRVIYMSSFSIYDYARMRNGEEVTEESPLEADAQSRGEYSLGKRQAEEIALSHRDGEGARWTILRPSLLVGRGRDIFNPVGPKMGSTLVSMSRRRKLLALIHVDDVAEAVLQVIASPQTAGRVYTLSHPEKITVRDYVNKYIRRGEHKDLRTVYVPYFVMACTALAARVVKKITGFGPSLNRRRLLSLYRSLSANSSRLLADTGWQPSGSLLERLIREEEVSVSQAAPEASPVPVNQA